MAPHSGTLAWKIPRTEEPGRLRSMGSLKSRTRLSDFTFTFHFHALEKEMATHPSVLAWRIPGGGLPSMGSHRVGHDWSDLAAAAQPLAKGFPSLTQMEKLRLNPGSQGQGQQRKPKPFSPFNPSTHLYLWQWHWVTLMSLCWVVFKQWGKAD